MKTKLWWWVALLGAGCAGTAPPPPTEPAAATTAVGSPAAATQSAPAHAAPTAAKRSLRLGITPARFGDLPEAWASHDWDRAIVEPDGRATLAGAADGRVQLRLPRPVVDARLWLQVDDRTPRAADQVGRLSDLATEWDPLQEGHHRLTLFATGSDGGVLSSDAGPVLASVSFVVGAAEPASVSRRLVLMSPYGTLNGSRAANTARLQFWDGGDGRPHHLVVNGPGGAVLERALTAGSYTLSELQSGDYTFTIDGACGAAGSQLTVNLDLEPPDSP